MQDDFTIRLEAADWAVTPRIVPDRAGSEKHNSPLSPTLLCGDWRRGSMPC